MRLFFLTQNSSFLSTRGPSDLTRQLPGAALAPALNMPLAAQPVTASYRQTRMLLIDVRNPADALVAHRMNVSGRVAAFYTVWHWPAER